MSILRASLVVLVCAALACAKAGEGDEGGDDPGVGGQGAPGGFGGGTASGAGGTGAGGTGAGGTGAGGTGTGGTGTGSGTGGTGGDPGPICDPPQHLCGGICTGNTTGTGCYQSLTCDPCPSVINGTAICTAQGVCAASCNSPYVPSGNTCICPDQCCSNADCGGSATCNGGTCVDPCDEPLCIALCLLQGKIGICIADQCVCIG